MEQSSLGLCWDGESFRYTNELHFVTSELLLAVVLLLIPFLCNSSCVKPRREDLKCVFELEKWQGPPAWGIKHNSFHSISFQHQYSRKQSWARRTGGILGHLFLSTRYIFKIRWGALIWEGQELGARGRGDATCLLSELFTDQLLFWSFVLLRNSYIVFAFCIRLSTSISLSALQRAINSVLQISLSNCWTLWLIVMQHISLRTINLY